MLLLLLLIQNVNRNNETAEKQATVDDASDLNPSCMAESMVLPLTLAIDSADTVEPNSTAN